MGEEVAITVTPGVGHTTPIGLRLDEAIADVLAGNADYWHVSVNGERCVSQAAGGEHRIERHPGRRESGRVAALLVAESSDEDPDVVVYVEGPERPSSPDAPRSAPALVVGGELEEAAARAQLLRRSRSRGHGGAGGVNGELTRRGRAGAPANFRAGCSSPAGSTGRLVARRSRSRSGGTTGASRTCAPRAWETRALRHFARWSTDFVNGLLRARCSDQHQSLGFRSADPCMSRLTAPPLLLTPAA